MTGKVVNLAEHKTDPHLSGEAVCLACGHEWVAVAPVGVNVFDCPKCGCSKGVMRAFCLPANGEVWECHCGCDLFRVRRSGIMCSTCGDTQVFP